MEERKRMTKKPLLRCIYRKEDDTKIVYMSIEEVGDLWSL